MENKSLYDKATTSATNLSINQQGEKQIVVTGMHRGLHLPLSWVALVGTSPLQQEQLSLHISSQPGDRTPLCIEEEGEEVRELCAKQAPLCVLLSRR